MTGAEFKLVFKLTIDTPYLNLMDEIWGVCCEDFGENWPCYNGTTLYNNFIQEHNFKMSLSIRQLICL